MYLYYYIFLFNVEVDFLAACASGYQRAHCLL